MSYQRDINRQLHDIVGEFTGKLTPVGIAEAFVNEACDLLRDAGLEDAAVLASRVIEITAKLPQTMKDAERRQEAAAALYDNAARRRRAHPPDRHLPLDRRA